MTSNLYFKFTVLFKGEYCSNWLHFYIVQLQIIHLLKLQYNVLLTRGPSVIAEPLVRFDWTA